MQRKIYYSLFFVFSMNILVTQSHLTANDSYTSVIANGLLVGTISSVVIYIIAPSAKVIGYTITQSVNDTLHPEERERRLYLLHQEREYKKRDKIEKIELVKQRCERKLLKPGLSEKERKKYERRRDCAILRQKEEMDQLEELFIAPDGQIPGKITSKALKSIFLNYNPLLH